MRQRGGQHEQFLALAIMNHHLREVAILMAMAIAAYKLDHEAAPHKKKTLLAACLVKLHTITIACV